MFFSKILNALITSSLAGVERRHFLSSSFLIGSNTKSVSSSAEAAADDTNVYGGDYTQSKGVDALSEWKVTLPLERFTGGTNCIRISLFGQPKRIGKRILRPKRVYRCIVDTGSAYLVIPQYKNEDSLYPYYFSTILEDLTPKTENKSEPKIFEYVLNRIFGRDTFYDENVPFELETSIYNPTEEIYGSQLGLIEWKQGTVILRDDRLVALHQSTILGVLDEALANECSVLVGFVKNTNSLSQKVDLHPTFFEQIGMQSLSPETMERREITSFQIDSPNKQLTLLANKDISLIPEDANNLIDLINLQPLGDFIEHYAFIVDELSLNYGEYVFTARSLSNKNQKLRPIVAVFDTGLTGCLFTKPLWSAFIQKTGVQNYAEVFSVEVSKIANESRERISIQSDTSKNPFYYLSSIELDWFDDEENAPYVVVLGQTFLSQGILTIDIDSRHATFQL